MKQVGYTDEDIIQSLRNCTSKKSCKHCPSYERGLCEQPLKFFKAILQVIDNLKAKVEELENGRKI